MRDFSLTQETLSYVTAESRLNTDVRYLTAGSKNCLIDRNRKVVIRKGIDRLGAGSTTENPIRSQRSWLTSTGRKWMVRSYDDELEVWIPTLDTTTVNGWYRIASSLSTTAILRFATVWKDTETLDILVFVQGDDNLYEWSGGVAVALSTTSNTITKRGTTTFGQNRFYSAATMTLINVRTGTEFTYTGGVGTTTLTGVSADPTADIVSGDILIQKLVTHSNEPAANRNNHTIGSFENHLLIGSNDDNEVYMTKNNDITAIAFSGPRVAGEGGLFTLDGPSKGFGKLGTQMVLFAGEDSIFRVLFKEVAVGAVLAEILDTKKILSGVGQGSYSPDFVVQLGNAIMYLSNEPALRYIQDPQQLEGTDPQTLSNPIKPDFDAETWTNGHAYWFKNALYMSAPTNGRVYILEFVEDADGKLRRFWQPPQTLGVRPFSDLDNKLYAGSNAVQETLQLFADDVYSDMIANGTLGNPDDKVSIPAVAAYAYNTYGKRGILKTFDEYYVEGEIRQNTDVTLNLLYDFGGTTADVDRIIEGDDSGILEETLLNASLGQQPLGQSPLGGSLNAPEDAAQFAVIFDLPRSDFRKIQAVFECDQIDAYFAILAHGPKIELSRRREVNIHR